MSKVASEPPTPWNISDFVGLLLLPIAILVVLIDAIVLRGAVYSKEAACPDSYRKL
ncbi:MAG: hypothetical protein MUC48_02920 [Leptolyngbya sp. Prado105]|jgi:hypothetical protein|nr:hypothetical protein [Leptolyngbya sp. Prado105]